MRQDVVAGLQRKLVVECDAEVFCVCVWLYVGVLVIVRELGKETFVCDDDELAFDQNIALS